MSALRKKTYSDVLRPSVAKTKLRAAYSRTSQVALGGIIAGAAAFASPLALYVAGSAVAQALGIGGSDVEDRMKWLIDYFGIYVVETAGTEQAIVNAIVLIFCFGVIGMISGFIYKMSTVSEDSTVFFIRRLRFPYEVLPFFIVMLRSSFAKASQVLLGFVVCVFLSIIWRFYYGKVLSVVSTVNVSKIIPDYDLR